MMAETYSKVQDSSLQEYSFGKASLVFEYFMKRNFLPPPVSIIALAFVIPAWIYFKFCKFAKERNSRDDEVYLSGPSGDLTMPRRREELLFELSREVNQSWDDMIEKRHVEEYSRSKETFENWICMSCHHFNVHDTYAHMLGYLYMRDATKAKKSVKLIASNSRMCYGCKHIQRSMSELEYANSVLSYVTFVSLLFGTMIVFRIIFFVLSIFRSILRFQKSSHSSSKPLTSMSQTMSPFQHTMISHHSSKASIVQEDQTSLFRRKWASENVMEPTLESEELFDKINNLGDANEEILYMLAYVCENRLEAIRNGEIPATSKDLAVEEAVGDIIARVLHHERGMSRCKGLKQSVTSCKSGMKSNRVSVVATKLLTQNASGSIERKRDIGSLLERVKTNIEDAKK
jgi:hypothetical protein